MSGPREGELGMMRRFLTGAGLVVAACLTCGSFTLAAEQCAHDLRAVEFLGTVDCGWFPESQAVLIDTMRGDPVERVRFAAVKAIQMQLERAKGPLDPSLGWRRVPDPQILVKLAQLIPGCTAEELQARLDQRRLSKAERRRRDVHCGCCTPEVMKALADVAFGMDESGCFREPSERIRERARLVLTLCCDSSEAAAMVPSPDGTMPPPTASQLPDTTFGRSAGGAGLGSGGLGGGANIPIPGRIDMTNRLNLFDNMVVQPQTRVWYGFQFAKGVNAGVNLRDQAQRLKSIFDSSQIGQDLFREATGYRTYDDFVSANNGVDTRFLRAPDAVLHRFGFEYAITKDFSFAMQAQYYSPLEDVGQPALFTPPGIFLKQVLYRGEDRLLTGIFGLSPQIPLPQFGIAEGTTRFAPGILYYQALGDEQNWFMVGAAQMNIPSNKDAILTADWALNLGYWLYRDQSIQPFATAVQREAPRPWLMAIVPQVNLLGKHVLNNNQVLGQFGTSTRPPVRAGTNPDGSTDVIFPDDGVTKFGQSTFTFIEPRDVVDLTTGVSLVFRGGWQWNSAISVPLTRGNVRPFEFLTTVNYYF